MRSEEAFRNWKHDLCDMLKDTVEPGGPSLLSSLLQRLRQVGYVVKGQTGQQSESLSQNKSRAKEGRRCHLLVECLCAWLRVQSITRPPPIPGPLSCLPTYTYRLTNSSLCVATVFAFLFQFIGHLKLNSRFTDSGKIALWVRYFFVLYFYFNNIETLCMLHEYERQRRKWFLCKISLV